jgi:drug/metabolite transporter (DMT)-like permease
MLKGIVLLLMAELCFAASTVFAKLVTNTSAISGIEIASFRFLIGFVASAYTVYKLKIPVKPNNKKLVLWRAFLNTTAVILFFLSVQHTSITNANMLNMTYPVFIFLFSPLFIKSEKPKFINYIFLILSCIGIYFVINPNFNHIQIGDIFGLISGIVGGFSVITLRKARENDSTVLILFYLMGIGLIINALIVIPTFIAPQGINIFYVICSAVIGFAGQVFMTSGYKHISARDGSLVSGSRIIFAVLLGVAVFSEDINFRIIAGGLLILTSITGVSLTSYKIKFPFSKKSIISPQ